LEELRAPDIYQWDVSFIGNVDNKRYPEHEKRVRFLAELENFLKEKRINFLFADSRDMSFNKQIDIIQRSKINLSCLTASDSSKYGKSWGLPERCYGVPACGGFLLMEDRIHVKDDFNAEEVVIYADIKDCMNKILYYLTRHEERRSIAEKAYLRVINEHTYEHRSLKLIAEIQELKNNVNPQKY
jgi:spore maturation protein CgeB